MRRKRSGLPLASGHLESCGHAANRTLGREMHHPICATCGVQFSAAEAPPAACPVCEDARQWVPEDGQRWTTLADLAGAHRNEIRDDSGLTGIGTEPWFVTLNAGSA